MKNLKFFYYEIILIIIILLKKMSKFKQDLERIDDFDKIVDFIDIKLCKLNKKFKIHLYNI